MKVLDEALASPRPPGHPHLRTTALVTGRLLVALLGIAVLALAAFGVAAAREVFGPALGL